MSSTSGTSILLVEDDPLLRGAFRLLLEDAGYHVQEAGTAGDALRTISDDPPDLILLDLGLPDRSGLDLARQLRAQPGTAETPIIALTGHTAESDRIACLGAGCSSFLAKPVGPRHLLSHLDSWAEPLGQRRSRRNEGVSRAK